MIKNTPCINLSKNRLIRNLFNDLLESPIHFPYVIKQYQ